MTDISAAFSVVKRMLFMHPIYTSVEGHHFIIMKQELPVIVPVVLIMVALLLATNFPISFFNEKGIFRKTPAPLKAIFCSILILAMVTFLPDNSKPFIYFQF